MKKVLLLEPNYKNKYPPMGLMKIATYFRKKNYDVRFFKGDLRELSSVLLCEEFLENADKMFYGKHFNKLVEYVKSGKYDNLNLIPNFIENENSSVYIQKLYTYRDRFKNKNFPQFDIICITTLFTFYWKDTIDTINYAKHFCKKGEIKIGGIAASLLPEEIKKETGIFPHIGIWKEVDNMPLDYSILEEIDYKYPANNAYFSYATRGCINKCKFCAVPKLEPEYENYIPLLKTIKQANEKFGEKRNLLLMDNNVFASDNFNKIIDEIKKCGFEKGALYSAPNEYDIAIKNLDWNKRAYLKKLVDIYENIAKKLPKQEQADFYIEREKLGLLHTQTATKFAISQFDKIAKPLFNKFFKKSTITRHIDFNQGLDARLATEEKIKELSEVNIYPLRIAFDHLSMKNVYERAVRLAEKYNIRHLSNYLLYNFNDKPEDLYERMKLNVELCEELNIAIYSFPMKYHPIYDPKYFRNRNYIGKHWNKKYIRAVQAVLNSTKGKIGRGKSFFEKAFGKNKDEFFEILEMPETFILYRFFFEWLEIKKHNISTEKWKKEFCSLQTQDKEDALNIIHKADFNNVKFDNPRIAKLINYYTNYRDDIITQGTELWKLKKEFDSLPK